MHQNSRETSGVAIDVCLLTYERSVQDNSELRGHVYKGKTVSTSSCGDVGSQGLPGTCRFTVSVERQLIQIIMEVKDTYETWVKGRVQRMFQATSASERPPQKIRKDPQRRFQSFSTERFPSRNELSYSPKQQPCGESSVGHIVGFNDYSHNWRLKYTEPRSI